MLSRTRILFLIPTLLIPLLLVAKPSVIASFSIPADWAKATGGDAVTVTSLTPPRSDLHAVQPTPAQVKSILTADLVVAIHPQLETWLAKLESTGDLRRPVLWLGIPVLGKTIGHCCDHPGHRHAPVATTAENDPHLWMDPELAASLAVKLGSEIETLVSPADAPGIRTRTAGYEKSLRAMTADIRQTLAVIPASRRKIISQHDNLRRFAKKFDLTVVGTLAGGASPEASDPSARKIAGTLNLIKKEKIPAVFADSTLAARLPESIAKESGLPAPTVLAIDALDQPGSPADSYAGLMRENARRIADALK